MGEGSGDSRPQQGCVRDDIYHEEQHVAMTNDIYGVGGQWKQRSDDEQQAGIAGWY